MTNRYRFRTDWIADIQPDPAFINKMLNRISDAIDEDIEDYAFGIATDYIPAPPEDSDENSQAYEDAMQDQVVSPLFDLIEAAIFAKLAPKK